MRLLTLLVLLIAPPALADTACDMQPRGAGGLCNAYCAALDCDGEPSASPAACQKVLARWLMKTAGDYGDVPACDITPEYCPCNDIDGVSDFLAGMPLADMCDYRANAPDRGDDLQMASVAPRLAYTVGAENGFRFCWFSSAESGFSSRVISEAEYFGCFDELWSSIDDQGLVCREG